MAKEGYGKTDGSGKALNALNGRQRSQLSAMAAGTCVFAIGPAGCGKTYLATRYASQALLAREIKQIIVTRPPVCAGRGKHEALPGTILDKFQPWLWPFVNGFRDEMGKTHFEYCLDEAVAKIVCLPLAYAQGTSFDDAIILVDEAENLTLAECKMLLTRVGLRCKIMLCGDIEQAQIANSGLLQAAKLMEGVDGVYSITYTAADCDVRSPFCRAVLERFSSVKY